MPDMDRRTFIRISGFTAGALATAYSLGKFMPLLEEKHTPVVDPDEPPLLPGEDFYPTTCWVGTQNCGINVRRYNGRMIRLEGHIMHPQNSGKLCPKGQAQLIGAYDPFRVKAPLIRMNEKGVQGRWREASWVEAITMVGDQIRTAMDKDPKYVVWSKGRGREQPTFDEAFINTTEVTFLDQEGLTAGAGHRANDYTLGYNAGLMPDFRYCNYMISWGWNLLGSGGNKHCWLTHQMEFMGARERGMKVITLDPRLGGMGPHTDKWLHIRPGTDMAFFLAIANVLLEKGYIDNDYMVGYTNAPFLVKDDEQFLKVNGKEQVIDVSGDVKDFDDPHVVTQLEGEAEVDGTTYRTAFSIYRERIKQYDPEWAEGITGIQAAQIQAIGEELGHQATIGSKITIDPSKAKPCYAECHGDPFEGAGGAVEGEARDYVFRPVGIMADHVTQQEMGFQATRAAVQVFMLLGAIDAVGGAHSEFIRQTSDAFPKYDSINIREPPYDITLKDSKYYPLNSVNPSVVAQVVNSPAKYEVDYTPDVLIVRSSNDVIDAASQPDVIESYSKYKFIAVIDPWLNETADHYADVVLPSATLEEYDGPLDVGTMYTRAASLRLPAISPMYRSMMYPDIIINIAEAADVLYGEDGYINQLNLMLNLQSAFWLDVEAKPQVRTILSNWARSRGIEEGVRFFEENGVSGENRPPQEIYAAPDDRTPNNVRHRFYGDSLARARDQMNSMGAGPGYWRDYTPLPTWRPLTFDDSPSEYDLVLITYRKVQYLQSRATMFAHMNEIEPHQYLVMNTRTAEHKGIHEDDEVWIESHNSVTDETRRVRAKVQLVEGIEPHTVAMSQHYGAWVNGLVKDGGPTPNSLFFTGRGYSTNTADQSFHVKVKVTRAV